MIELMPLTLEEEVLQNVRMISGIWRSEVPLDRELGIDADILDAPLGQVKTLLTAEVISTVTRCEPRAKVKSLSFKGNAANGTLEPIIEFEVTT